MCMQWCNACKYGAVLNMNVRQSFGDITRQLPSGHRCHVRKNPAGFPISNQINSQKEVRMHNLIGTNKDFRRSERKPFAKSVDYFVSLQDTEQLSLKGRAIDISDVGIGIETDYPLAPGHQLFINGGIDKIGTVRWSAKWNDSYRAGIRLKTETVGEIPEARTEDRSRHFRVLDAATDRFNSRLEEIEMRCSDAGVRPEEIYREITNEVDDMMTACAVFEREVKDMNVIKQARTRFREKTNSIVSKSYCINRTRTWPQGSQGDHKTLELAYKNTPLSEGLGLYLDLYMLNLPLAEGVRNRIKMLEELLRQEIQGRSAPSVLNIACGSCRELMGVAPDITESGAKLVCIDNDNDALAYAQSRLAYSGISDEAEFFKYNALRLFDYEQSVAEFGMQDIIYSMGFFDYLPSDFLVKMFGTLFNMLNPDGRIIAPFKDARGYRSQEYHWLVDWDGFQQRKEEDFRQIMADAGIPEDAISEVRDSSGTIIFYIITK